jgi:hypothetical protein
MIKAEISKFLAISPMVRFTAYHRIVCADESAVNILTLYRRNGWSLQGL